MRWCCWFLAASLWAQTKVAFDPRDVATGPFPTDYLTVGDERQKTGRRVNLPQPDCATRSSDCAEVALLNEYDGFGLNPRITVRFTGPIQPESLRDNIWVAWLDPVPGRFGVYPAGKLTPVNEYVYDPATNTAFVKPDEVLEGGRQYVVLVTDGIRDAAGAAVGAHEGYAACLARQIGGEYCRSLSAAIGRVASLSSRRVVGASLFTTLSNTAFLEDARRIVQLTPTGFRRTTPGFATSGVRSIVFREQVRTSGSGRFTDEPLPVQPGQLSTTGRIAFFAYRSPKFTDATGVIPTTPTGETVQVPTTTEEIHGHVWLPSTPAPQGGYPVLLAGHGIGDSRLGMPTAIAAANSAGLAVVAISAVGHGYGPDSSYLFTQANGTVTEVPAPGRGRDLDGAGTIDLVEGCVIVAAGKPIVVRDCVRQTAIDMMQLVHAIREGVDLDGDGTRDLNPGAIQYLGQSLGAMYGTLLMAVEPDVTTAVLNAAEGSGTETGRLSPSPTLQLVTLVALGVRSPVLLNRGLGFVDQMPLRNQPVSILNVAGARELQDFWDRVEWLETTGAPIFYARHLKTATLPGVGLKRILFQMAFGDRTAVNPSTSRLIRTASMTEQTSLYRHDLVRKLAPDSPLDPHTFLIPWGTPAMQAVGMATIGQAMAFLGSGGQQIADPNPALSAVFGGTRVFEVPPASLPEGLNLEP